jgi:uncharacterized protein
MNYARALLCTFVAYAALQPAVQGGASDPLVVERNVGATLRDGIVLRADVYRPSAPGKYPVLLQRTPYSKRDARYEPQFRLLASNGFVVIVQDTRGRYMSDGVAKPHDEAEDGFDTIAWARTLPYVNGKVGMWGGSYLATTQLLAATLQPPGLVALFPSSSYNSRYDMVFQGGAFYLNDGLSWNLGQAIDVRRRVFTPDMNRDGEIGLNDDQRRAFRERWLWHVPLKSMDALELKRFAPGYDDMLNHPSTDSFWDTFNIEAKHDRFQVPAYHLTGWYDTLLNGTLHNFVGLRARAANETARRYQRLIIGPWTHSQPTIMSSKIGDVDFGPNAGFSAQDLYVQWFKYWLDGPAAAGPQGRAAVEGAPVRIFVMGANEWRDEQEWPLARAKATSYFLRSREAANTSEGDGTLMTTMPSDESTSDRYVYDPWDPVPTGASSGYSRTPSDQRPIEKRRDVLVYSTDPLPADLEVTGPVTLTLWVASSARDTDFTGKLVDVSPDGTARALADGILRARYRHDKSHPTLLTPGQPVELTIDLGATSNLFRAGHRVRLEVSSSNFPRFDRNPNTGGTFGEDTELLRAQQVVFHDRVRPSRLILPVVPH